MSQKSSKEIALSSGGIRLAGGLENGSRSETLTRMGGKERDTVSPDSFHSFSFLGQREIG